MRKSSTPKTITVTPAIAKALAASGKSVDKLLREALGIKTAGLETAEGVVFPEGTAFLAWYKDRPYWGHVKDGAIELNGEAFPSVSAAAVKITGRPTNGWDFWQAKPPGKSEFVRISKLRRNGKH
jgi:hypothetical protein